MTKYPLFLLFAAALLLFAGCGTKRVATDDANLSAMDGRALLSQLSRHQLQAEWLDGKARIEYDDGSMSIGGTASIKMRKDSLIWMSVKKFGFEVARAMVTPDSLYILDRINNEYAVEPLSYVEERYQLPANLAMMQQVLLGNAVFLTTANLQAQVEADGYRLTAAEGGKRNELWLTSQNFVLQRMRVADLTEERELDVTFAGYGDAGANRDFSYLRTLDVDSRETGRARITIEFSQVELNVPTDFHFSIPPRYQRMGK